MTDSLTPKNANIFICKKCAFKCSKKSEYVRHLSTDKHIRLINTDNGVFSKSFICNCGKSYNNY